MKHVTRLCVARLAGIAGPSIEDVQCHHVKVDPPRVHEPYVAEQLRPRLIAVYAWQRACDGQWSSECYMHGFDGASLRQYRDFENSKFYNPVKKLEQIDCPVCKVLIDTALEGGAGEIRKHLEQHAPERAHEPDPNAPKFSMSEYFANIGSTYPRWP